MKKLFMIVCFCLVAHAQMADGWIVKRDVGRTRGCKRLYGDFKNGIPLRPNIPEHATEFQCEPGYISNVPLLDTFMFQCKFFQSKGGYIWYSLDATYHGQNLLLDDVECFPEIKVCVDPEEMFGSQLPDNMIMKRLAQRTLEVVADGRSIERVGALPGEKIAFECQNGYASEQEVSATDPNDYYGNYFYGENTEDTTVDLTTELMCMEDGSWEGSSDINFGLCSQITCNATYLKDLRHGKVINYQEQYIFNEVLLIECDYGYKSTSRTTLKCLEKDSFSKEDIRCKAIQCPEPSVPFYGDIGPKQMVYRVGDNVTHYCLHGYDMIGKADWTCQENGEWDSQCVICVNKDDHCPSPCIPPGASVLQYPRTFGVGAQLSFTCKSGKEYSGDSNITCLLNRHWSGQRLDCTGWSVFDNEVGSQLRLSLKTKIDNIEIEFNATENNDTQDGGPSGRSIQVGNAYGVDLYIVVDVSKSIDDSEYNKTKEFLKALLPIVGINKFEYGTRLALYYFASTSKKIFNTHYAERAFSNYTEAQAVIDKVNITTGREKIGSGTAITNALNDILVDIDSKKLMENFHGAQQIIILISDGKFTQMGDPKAVADMIKTKENTEKETEIYSIALGTIKDAQAGFDVMKDLASVIEGEEHFFKINAASKDDLERTIKLMIDPKSVDISCGATRTSLTNIQSQTEAQYDTDAQRYAWPWMVQLRTNIDHKCGGSLINNQWILTAAHCFEACLTKIRFKTLETDDKKGNDEYIEKALTLTCDQNKYATGEDVIMHHNYTKTPNNYDYDLALIRLKSPLEFDLDMHAVCLWNDDLKGELENFKYGKFFEKNQYGVVTGWGYIDKKKTKPTSLKQLQMPIQENKTCEASGKENNTKPNSDIMFCAGTVIRDGDNKKMIDTCSGDSGGPFVVSMPTKPYKYIQIGIVSHGPPVCKQVGKYGFYTKLNTELLDWIATTVKKEDEKRNG